MTRNYEIAEFRETDDLGPTATRKLNSNFRNMLSVMRDMSVGGVDTGAIAAYVLDSVDDSIEDLDRRVDVLEQQGGGGTSGVTGVKGFMEDVFRTGNVTLMLEDIEDTITNDEIAGLWEANYDGN